MKTHTHKKNPAKKVLWTHTHTHTHTHTQYDTMRERDRERERERERVMVRGNGGRNHSEYIYFKHLFQYVRKASETLCHYLPVLQLHFAHVVHLYDLQMQITYDNTYWRHKWNVLQFNE